MIGKKVISKIPKGVESFFKKKKVKSITKTVNKYKKPIKAKTKKVKKAIKKNPRISTAIAAGATGAVAGSAYSKRKNKNG